MPTPANTAKTDQMAMGQTNSPTVYTIHEARYEVATQNIIVQRNVPFFTSPFAAATAAKHGIVVMLKIINAINAGTVTPVS